jgi:hypothetical protein
MAVRVKDLDLGSDSHELGKILLAMVKATVAAIVITVKTRNVILENICLDNGKMQRRQITLATPQADFVRPLP